MSASPSNHVANPGDTLIPTTMTPPLLRMPTEILGMILQDFAPPLEHGSDEFKPHWCSSLVDGSPLVPVSQTCRRLRDVVQTLPQVMKSIVMTESAQLDFEKLHALNKDITLNVYISFFQSTPAQVRDWYITEATRIQELHLTRLGHLSTDFWTPLLALPAPKLRFLSLTSPVGVSWLPPKGVFLPLPAQASHLRHITLKGVCFLPQNHLTSLTHLALFDLFVPKFDINLIKVLRHCDNLESLVLSNVRESLEGKATKLPTLCLPHLRRVTLHEPVSRKLAFYFSLLPRAPNSALQLLDFTNEPQAIRPLISKYSPNAHTVCITHHIESRTDSESTDALPKRTLDPERGSLSVTTIGPDGTFHAMVPISARRSFMPTTMLKDVLAEKSSLARVREAWLIEVRATKQISDTEDLADVMPLFIREDSSTARHRLAVAVRPEIAALPALEVLVHVFRRSLEPNLYMLPSTQNLSFASRNFKTLKIVLCHGIGMGSSTQKRPELNLAKVSEGLATGQYAYLDTLILQMAPTVVVNDAEILAISKFVPTVKVERINTIPELALPEYCKEPASRGSWLGALW